MRVPRFCPGSRSIRQARDGRWAANFLLLITIAETVAELSNPPDDLTYQSTMEFCIILPAGYLLGRAIAAWIHTRDLEDVDLHEL